MLLRRLAALCAFAFGAFPITKQIVFCRDVDILCDHSRAMARESGSHFMTASNGNAAVSERSRARHKEKRDLYSGTRDLPVTPSVICTFVFTVFQTCRNSEIVISTEECQYVFNSNIPAVSLG
jgi:hypothetical protein